MDICIKRIYEEPSPDDGARILIDRLWPRGISKQDARIVAWFKNVAPSVQLRMWYEHDPVKFPEFEKRYRAELISNKAFSDLLEFLDMQPKVTLLFAAKDKELSNAAVLSTVIREHLKD